ncbi:MAG: carboxypeptidase M32 [Bdellovibrionales bacterium]|nr:carboxypeptidase M32 [Bdellovibrionales bacterium]
MSANSFSTLLEQFKTIACVESIEHLLEWDQQVMMPKMAGPGRGEQSAFIAGTFHELLSSKRLQDLIGSLKQQSGLNDLQQAIVEDADWRVSRAVKVPNELAKRIAGLKVKTIQAWETARATESFSGVEDLLEELFSAYKERCTYVDSKTPLYQVMVADYERGAAVEDLRKVFSELRVSLVELVNELKELGSDAVVCNFGEKDFPKNVQAEVCHRMVAQLGFPFDEGRLDTTIHPFCNTCGPRDIRLTTRYLEHDFIFGLTSAMHEAGHGLYELGLDKDYIGTAKGRYCGLGVHESQSIMWERHVGLSSEFWSYCYPQVRPLFPALSSVDEKKFYKHIHRVKPGLIRIASDEITYHLHIIARFELEVELVGGSLSIKDLPEAWDEKYHSMLGIRAESPRDGVLQDIHWYGGHFGYFPTYSLGAMYAAQLFSAFEKSSPNWRDDFSKGNFEHLLGWLRQNIYQHGAVYLPKDLITRASGSAPNPRYLIDYLRNKYLGIFKS